MEEIEAKLEESQLKIWKRIVQLGCENASRALYEMLGVPLKMSGIVLAFMPLSKIPFLAGDPEEEVFGGRLFFSGDISGQMLLILSKDSIRRLLEILMEQPLKEGEELGEIEYSAIAEVTNIVSSNFIRDLANFTDLLINLTPPELIIDMTATVIQSSLITLSMNADYALTVETTFIKEEEKIKGFFFFIPQLNSIKKILGKFSELENRFMKIEKGSRAKLSNG